MRFREGVTGTWWGPMPGGEESDRGAGGGSGGEASGGASQSRSSHSGTDRSSVGRGRAVAGVGGRGLVAGASAAGMEQSPVRPAIAGGRLGTPSRSRGTAVAAGGSAVSHSQSCRHANSAAASSPCAGECVPDSRPRGSAAPVAAGAAARVGRVSRRRRRRAPDGGAHGTPKGTRPARIPEEDRARVAGAWLVLEDLSLVQFELYEGTGWNPPSP